MQAIQLFKPFKSSSTQTYPNPARQPQLGRSRPQTARALRIVSLALPPLALRTSALFATATASTQMGLAWPPARQPQPGRSRPQTARALRIVSLALPPLALKTSVPHVMATDSTQTSLAWPPARQPQLGRSRHQIVGAL